MKVASALEGLTKTFSKSNPGAKINTHIKTLQNKKQEV